MHRLQIPSLLILLVLLSGNAYATGNDLLKNCESLLAVESGQNVTVQIGAGRCGGFIEGIVSLTKLYGFAQRDTYFCLPDGVNVGQTVRVVVKYLQDHPEELHQNSTGLVIIAIRNAFPCND